MTPYEFDRMKGRAVLIADRVHDMAHDDAVTVILDALLDVRRQAQDEMIDRLEQSAVVLAEMLDRVTRLEAALLASGGRYSA